MVKEETRSFQATLYRGGTSNGLLINANNLPDDQKQWQSILSGAMGSPDPYGRQLNGMGSGISSTSKVMVVRKSERVDADVDYTFVQVGIKDGSLDMAGNCGNMSSAVGPFSWDEGLVRKTAGVREVTVRMFNSNTSKVVLSTFSLGQDGNFEPCGDYSIDGVPGQGSRITLSFVDPAGAKTGKALPTGEPIDILTLPNGNTLHASLIDVGNPGVFIRAADIGVPGDVPPDVLASSNSTMERLEDIRQAGAQLMGLDPRVQSVPKIVIVSKPTEDAAAQGINIVCRALSMQQAHGAVPLTLALNLGAACILPGTIPATTAVGAEGKGSIIVAHASGKIEVGSEVKDHKIESVLLHRTARVLMKGHVFYTVNS